ncbi:aldehyde dehydrogenase EutE [candidate division KSB1 bacterium]|nr:aldehyde dehydrogenase EutE [candidate division KSB1 bacterium]
MQSYDANLIADIVKNVMARLEQEGILPQAGPEPVNGIFEAAAPAISASVRAQKVWVALPKDAKAKVIAALRKTMHEYAEDFSRRACTETGLGRVEDKIVKHHNAADSTPGLEDLEVRAWSSDKGVVVEEYAPYGVIAAITPSTHPIPVLFNSAVMIIAAGNGVVFNVHPAAKKVSAYALEIFNRVIQENGGPANLITMIREPSLESVQQLFHDPRIHLIVATGGPGLVKAAFEAGKKVIAAGPGNPPVFVDETACLTNATKYIIQGASFDNNILCIAEKEVLVVQSKFDDFMRIMAEQGAVQLNPQQIEALTQKVFRKNEQGQITINREFIGKNANVLARAVGFELTDAVRLLYGETQFDHPFVQEEQMMPFLPIVRVQDVADGIEKAVAAEHGFGHTAIIHSNKLSTITKFTQALDTDIVVVNGPSLAGNGGYSGEGYFSHTIASPTGEGICTPRNFARMRRLTTFKSLNQVS